MRGSGAAHGGPGKHAGWSVNLAGSPEKFGCSLGVMEEWIKLVTP
jgi:hypothetical protein